jgi:hypothetical protein
MNIFIAFLLQSILPIIEQAIASEGPAAVAWLEAEIAKLGAKYTSPMPPSAPTVKAPTTPVA